MRTRNRGHRHIISGEPSMGRRFEEESEKVFDRLGGHSFVADGVGTAGGGGVNSTGSEGIGTDNSGPGGTSTDTSGGGGIGSDFLARAVAASSLTVPDPSMRRTDMAALHPVMRDAVTQLLKAFQTEGLPFRLFEAFRSPVRQAWLYEQGRSRKGQIVTYAQAWQSYHQYGLAADFVLWINSDWSWNTLGINKARWTRLHELGAKVGLEPLKFETPHLQVAGLRIEDLQKGEFPSNVDSSWRDNIEGAIISWNGTPPAPPITSLRPALSEG